MKLKNPLLAGCLAVALLCMTAAASAADVRMFVRHEVADYGTWRKSFDGFAATQKKLGVTYKAVYQSADNPNDVTVIHDFHSLEAARSFAASAELKAAMEKAGVKGAPQVWFATKSD